MTYLSFVPIGVPASSRLVFRPVYPQDAITEDASGLGSGVSRRRKKIILPRHHWEVEEPEKVKTIPMSSVPDGPVFAVTEEYDDDDEIVLMTLSRILNS